MNRKNFQLSCPLFWGFNRYIDMDECYNNQDIINKLLYKLKDFLKDNNLLSLLDKLKDKEKDYHIHDYTFDKILLSKEEKIYICRHCF